MLGLLLLDFVCNCDQFISVSEIGVLFGDGMSEATLTRSQPKKIYALGSFVAASEERLGVSNMGSSGVEHNIK